jgi:hypothetical protein
MHLESNIATRDRTNHFSRNLLSRSRALSAANTASSTSTLFPPGSAKQASGELEEINTETIGTHRPRNRTSQCS